MFAFVSSEEDQGKTLLKIGFLVCLLGGLTAAICPTVRPLVFSSDFLGAVTGAFLAIAGAVYVEDRKSSTEAKRNRQLLRDALTDTSKALRQIAQDRETPLPIHTLTSLRNEALAALEGFAESVELLDEALTVAKTLNYEEMRALRKAKRQLASEKAMFEHETKVVENGGPTLAIMSIYYSKSQPAAARIVQSIDDAIDKLGGAVPQN